MKTLLLESLTAAMVRLKDAAGLVELSNINESTFRFFLMSEIRRREVKARIQTEWKFFDLLVQTANHNALVELKFYLARRTFSLDGSPARPKGGASTGNTREFSRCVEKLRTTLPIGITDRFLILVHDPSFSASFESVAPDDNIASVDLLRHPFESVLTCKLLELR